MRLIFLILGILFTLIKFHLIFCIGLVVLHELLIHFLAQSIYDHGWIDQAEIDGIFKKGPDAIMDDFEYYSYLFVPGINLFVIWDIIYQATHDKEDEEVAEK